MLHTVGRCMPPCSYTRLGNEGDAVFAHGPVAVSKGDNLDCVVMSINYANQLERYIESLAIQPLILERGHLSSSASIGMSSHTGVPVFAVEPAREEWAKLHVNSKVIVTNECVRKIGSHKGPTQVLHHANYAFIKLDHLESLKGGMAITVYFVFRKDGREEKNTTFIGLLAGFRQNGVFDPATTGPFFTNEALQTFFDWQQKTKERYGDKATVSTGPTKEEMLCR